MRAVCVVDGGIIVDDRPEPVPGTGEVLVRVRAAGVNNADLLQMQGRYPAPLGSPPDIPGLELAGEVVALGPGSARFAPGDRVMAVVGGGAQAELAVVHERAAMPVPPGMRWEEAGALPEAFTTAHDALFTQCGLTLGERVCISAGAGGVGTAAVILASAAGARVTATVRNPDLRPGVAALGATAVAPDDLGRLGAFDVVLELVGAPNLAADLDALAVGGRIAVIGVGAGSTADVDLRVLMTKRARICGSTLRARPLEAKADAARRMEASVLPIFGHGDRHVPLVATYPLAAARAAYDRFVAEAKLGKIVLVP